MMEGLDEDLPDRCIDIRALQHRSAPDIEALDTIHTKHPLLLLLPHNLRLRTQLAWIGNGRT